MNKRLLIDADSLIYIIAYNHREGSDERSVKDSCDTFLADMMLMSGCDEYIGSFSSSKNFRHELYKYAEYKGKRPEKADYVKLWEPVIKEHYVNKHGFIVPGTERCPVELEADDVVVALAHLCIEDGIKYVIASPDKDLRQVQGIFYNYAKQGEDIPVTTEITPVQAQFNFWFQMLTGDSTDNILAVPGLGPVKALKLLDGIEAFQMKSVVLSAYCKYFGSYYGNIIFAETFNTIMLLSPKHMMWEGYRPYIEHVHHGCVHTLQTAKGIFDV